MPSKSHQDEILKVLIDAILEDGGVLSPAVLEFAHRAAVRSFRWVNAFSGELPREYIQAGSEILGDPTWFYPLVEHYPGGTADDVPYCLKGDFFTRTDPRLLRVVEEVNRTTQSRDIRIYSEPGATIERGHPREQPPGNVFVQGWHLLPEIFQDDTGIEFAVYRPTKRVVDCFPDLQGPEGPRKSPLKSLLEDKDPLNLFLSRVYAP